MTRVAPFAILLVAVAVGVVVLASSGGSKSTHNTGQASGYAAPSQSTGSTTPSHPAVSGGAVNVRTTSLGKVLVNGDGRTLYLFEADKANKSNCSGACLSQWPALTAAKTPSAVAGIQAGKLGTIAAAGGKRQVTYNGHPLYSYIGDQKAGDTTGQGIEAFGAEWYVVSPSGSKIDEG